MITLLQNFTRSSSRHSEFDWTDMAVAIHAGAGYFSRARSEEVKETMRRASTVALQCLRVRFGTTRSARHHGTGRPQSNSRFLRTGSGASLLGQEGKSADCAVECALRLMEDARCCNAGTGCNLNAVRPTIMTTSLSRQAARTENSLRPSA